MLLTVYLDDVLLMGLSDLCAKVSQLLSAAYELITLVKYLLGVEILIDRQRLHEELRAEVTKIIESKPLPPYQNPIGAFQYLVPASRPDIAHAVRHLSEYLSCFDCILYAMAKRGLRHLVGTDDTVTVSGLRSQQRTTLSWCATPTLTTQTTLMAERETRDLLRLIGLCEERRGVPAKPEIRGDNNLCIYLIAKTGKYFKSEHTQNKFHVVRRHARGEQHRTLHLSTNDMVANSVTKPLPTEKFQRCRGDMKGLRIDRV
ncbi:hypothetical protein PC128_g3733 [Phytophthora cactorum]|nr:hypothetical protein PC121_g24226 [Phytophthora cactorum]KAG3201692.1 hypothetical protein PC128_g3733 [Phytophthora cactorum]KAG4040532.1 hypothetical protein PC123_g23930 [Phytophthora cactorum]